MEKRKRVQRGDISPDEDSFEPASSGEDEVREREDDPDKVDGQAPQTPSGGVEKGGRDEHDDDDIYSDEHNIHNDKSKNNKKRSNSDDNDDEDDDDNDDNDNDDGSDDGDQEDGEDEQLPPAREARSKKPRKRKGSNKRMKRSLQHYLWTTVDAATRAVQCRLCTHQRKFHLSNCKSHWVSDHIKEWTAVEEANERGNDVEAVVRTLLETRRKTGVVALFRNSPGNASVLLRSGKKAEISGKIRKELAWLHFLISNKIAFNATSSKSFQVLQNEWGVQLDGKSKILELMEPMYLCAVAIKEEALKKCGAVSCAIDFWTSAGKRKYLAITYHAISPEWTMAHHLMDLIHFPGSTFAELIGACVSARIEEHLPGDILSVAIVSDRGGDVKKARNAELDADGEDCLNHRLNSAMNDVLATAKRRKSVATCLL